MDDVPFGSYRAGSPPHPDEKNPNEQETSKHADVHVCMHPSWVAFPLQLRVNRRLEISVNGGPWHGSAIYDNTTGTGIWTLTFHYKANLDRLKENKYVQIRGAASYMNLNEKDNGYNNMLITKTHGLIS